MLKSSDKHPEPQPSARTGLCSVLCTGAQQPAVEGNDLQKPPAHAGSLHGLCGSPGRFGDKKPVRIHKPREAVLSFGTQVSPVAGGWGCTHAKCPHVLVLLLHSSLCTHFGPFWRQNLGLEGSLPYAFNHGVAEDSVVQPPLEGSSPLL